MSDKQTTETPNVSGQPVGTKVETEGSTTVTPAETEANEGNENDNK